MDDGIEQLRYLHIFKRMLLSDLQICILLSEKWERISAATDGTVYQMDYAHVNAYLLNHVTGE